MEIANSNKNKTGLCIHVWYRCAGKPAPDLAPLNLHWFCTLERLHTYRTLRHATLPNTPPASVFQAATLKDWRERNIREVTSMSATDTKVPEESQGKGYTVRLQSVSARHSLQQHRRSGPVTGCLIAKAAFLQGMVVSSGGIASETSFLSHSFSSFLQLP